MTSTSEPPAVTAIRLRALVVEMDEAVRLKVSGLLQRLGCDVHACASFSEAAVLYDHQDIIVTMVNGDSAGLSGFVERVRAGSGDAQPYILGLVSGSSVTPPANAGDAGMNDLLPWPPDAERLSTRLTAIVRQCSEQPRRGLATAPHDGWSSPATQVLLEQLPAAVAVLDTGMRYLAANQRWRREFQLLGMPVLGQSHYDLFPDLHHAWRELYARCLSGQRERMDDEIIVRPDGKTEWMRWDVQPWRDGSAGSVGGLILSATILTEDTRDRATMAFEQNIACSLLHTPLAPVVLVDTAGRIQRANDSARRISGGHAIHEGQTFFWNALSTPVRREAARNRVQELLKIAASSRNVTWPVAGGRTLVLPPGEGRSTGIAWSVFPHCRADGVLEGLIFLGFPPAGKSPTPMIEEATPAPSSAVADELGSEDYRRIAEAAPFGMIVLNEEAAVLYANPQHRTVLGFSIAECGGITEWLERACAADDEFKVRALDEWWERVWRRRAAWTCSMRTAGGMLKEIEFRPSPLPDHRLLLTIFDVTDAQLEEQALRASEARYRGLFQNCAAGVAVLNSSGNITETNPALEQITGLSRTELRRSNLTAFLSHEDAARIREAAAAGQGSASEIVTTVKTKDGGEIRAGLSWSVVKNEAGVTVYTACLLHPLSAAAATSAPSSPGVSATPAWAGTDWSRTVPDWVILIDAHGRILEHSDARDFAGVVPRDGLAGRTLEECVPAIADLLPVDVMIERLHENPGAETRCEFSTVLTAGGKPRFIEARMISLTPAGTVGRYGLIVRDLTSAANRTRETGGVLPWLRNVTTPVILTNERGRITGLNPAAEQLLGWTGIALEGSGLFRIFRPDEPKAFSDEISAELTRNRCWKARTFYYRQNGTKEECDVELVPAHDEVSGSRGFITSLRPVSKSEPAAGAAAGRPSVSLHRARNDLQILSSLLALQADRTTNETAKTALLSGKDRLNAVSIVYRLINSEEDTVDFVRYASELGHLLLDTRRISSDRIKIDVAGESARIPQKIAITLGIILEELISAAIAESFPNNSSGTIRISFTTGGGEGVLIVRDNGTLLTDSLRESRLGSFSWHVVQTLAEPIGGVVTLLSDLENQVRMRFRLTPLT